jgi:hypothetical protein
LFIVLQPKDYFYNIAHLKKHVIGTGLLLKNRTSKKKRYLVPEPNAKKKELDSQYRIRHSSSFIGLASGVLSDPWNASALPAMGAAASVHSASPLPGPAFHTSPGRGSAPLAGIPIADPWTNPGHNKEM